MASISDLELAPNCNQVAKKWYGTSRVILPEQRNDLPMQQITSSAAFKICRPIRKGKGDTDLVVTGSRLVDSLDNFHFRSIIFVFKPRVEILRGLPHEITG